MRYLLFTLAVLIAACTGTQETTEVTPDDQFGHRYEGTAPDGRETVVATDPDTTEAYIMTPAVLDSVSVRLARRTAPASEAVPVEVLVKGALPDACSELNPPEQERVGHLLSVTLEMRRPRGAFCAQVVRPFRFYLPLDGTFAPGAYTLTLNGTAYPFRIREGEVENG